MQDLTTLTINVKDPWKDPANGWDVLDGRDRKSVV